MTPMGPRLTKRVLLLLSRTVYRHDRWCANWAWQATGIKSTLIGSTIKAAADRGLVQSADRGRGFWWKVSDEGKRFHELKGRVEKPQRVQLKRTKGWRMPPNTVKVTRPGPFGNPFRASDFVHEANRDAKSGTNRNTAVSAFAAWIMYRDQDGLRARIRKELRGRNLACWCKPGAPCHADVLLKIANKK